MTSDLRTVEKGTLVNTEYFSGFEWKTINFIELKQGDHFRLYDPDGSLVHHEDGRTIFVAKSNPNTNELGVLEIEI